MEFLGFLPWRWDECDCVLYVKKSDRSEFHKDDSGGIMTNREKKGNSMNRKTSERGR